MPVCKSVDNDSEGGELWSLVIYHRNDNKWYHMDSIGNCNNSIAHDLVKNINFYMTKENQPDFVEVSCTQQRNGYDCGPFVGLFAKKGEDRNKVSDRSNKINSVNKSLRITCWYYKRRTCKYGSGYKDLHPLACKK